MSAACHSQNKRPRSSSDLNPLNGNVLGNENDKLIVDTTELRKNYDTLKGLKNVLQEKYDQLKGFSTELQKKYVGIKELYFPMRERLQTEEATCAKIQEELLQAKERLQQITQLHDQCHDSKEALDLYKKKCFSLQDELQQMTVQLKQATLEPNTTDSMQIENEQELPVAPVVTPVQVNSMTWIKSSCCPTQKIESLEGIIKEYEEKLHPKPLYNPGRFGFHPDGTPDLEARAIMKNALVLAETLSAAAFESLCIRFNEKNLKYRVGIASARADIAEKIDGLIPFSSEDVKEIVVRAISTCAARMLVWKPEAKEECQDLELINQALRDAAKDAIRASSYYDSNPYAAESTNKVIDESRIGANFIIMVNKCPTFGGFSAACGGICPPGKKLTDCASGRVFTALAQCLDSPSDYTWGSDNLGVLGENGRMACLLPPPPLGHYSSCPDATTIELSTLTHFYTILVSMLRIGGCNLLLLCCAGITSNFYKELISTVEVDDDFVKELLSKIDRDVVPPMNGQLVKCGEESTRHLKCFTVFTSSSVDRQLSQMCQSVASIADCVEELAGPEHADEFTALAYKHEDLRFVTSSTTEIQALKTEYGHVEAAIAKKAETRKQEKAALRANRTEAEIEQEEQEAKLATNAIRRARYASRTADEKEQANANQRASKQARLASMTVEEKAGEYARRQALRGSVDCDHCGRPYESWGQGFLHKCTNKIGQVDDLECKQICQHKKIVEGVTWRCRSEKYKKPSADYYCSPYCGVINCLTDSKKKEANWFQL